MHKQSASGYCGKVTILKPSFDRLQGVNVGQFKMAHDPAAVNIRAQGKKSNSKSPDKSLRKASKKLMKKTYKANHICSNEPKIPKKSPVIEKPQGIGYGMDCKNHDAK